jgi:hypothetical protein
VASVREETTMCVEPHVRPTNDTRPIGFHLSWPVDLDVVSVQMETRFNANGGRESVYFPELLEDGSRMVIASQSFHLSLLPLSAWEEIEELVWGD